MRRLVFSFCLLLIVSLLGPAVIPRIAHADVNDFVIERFDADYILSRSDPQGELEVQEVIEVNFTDNNHGILRALPNTYKHHRLQLHVERVELADAPVKWSTYQSNGNTVIKIGDPDKTVTGKQHFTIGYTVRNVIGFYGGHDELFWDVNGDQWAQRAERVSLILYLPDGLRLSDKDPICYTGSFGSNQRNCVVRYDPFNHAVQTQTTQALQPYQTLSVVAGFDKGFFRPSTWRETMMEYAGTAAAFAVPFVLLSTAGGIYWFRYGRDAKGRGTIVPEYEPPDSLSPLEAGTIVDFKTDNRDITATIIDLAVRGYIKIIEETKDRKFRRDTKSYHLRLLKSDFSGLNQYETKLIKNIFENQLLTNHPEGSEVDLSTLQYKLATTATSLRSSVRSHLVKAGYFRKNPLATTLRFAAVLGAIYLFSTVLAVLFGGAAVLGIAAGTGMLIIFMLLMNSRLPKGVEARERILGLKMYLQTAEAERIKKLQSPGAPYAPKSREPKKTVELFEKLLPYAMVLGVEAQWAKQFEHIYKSPPDWYQGNWSTFSTVYLASTLGSGVSSAVNSAFSSPSSSSSSGFSGGGAGGGGGGGGGGGW